MRRSKTMRAIRVVILPVLLAAGAAAHDEIHFAHDGAGKLLIDLHLELPLLMPESQLPEFPGYTVIDMGMVALDTKNTEKGLFILDPNCSIDVTLVSIDPELGFWTGAEFLRPMAAPVLGGILVADEVVDLSIPALFYWLRRHRWRRIHAEHDEAPTPVAGSLVHEP